MKREVGIWGTEGMEEVHWWATLSVVLAGRDGLCSTSEFLLEFACFFWLTWHASLLQIVLACT